MHGLISTNKYLAHKAVTCTTTWEILLNKTEVFNISNQKKSKLLFYCLSCVIGDEKRICYMDKKVKKQQTMKKRKRSEQESGWQQSICIIV